MFLYQFGKREAAVQEFETLFKAEPNDREARSRLVAAYVGLNRLSEAESVLAAALKANAKDTEALLQRAELRLKAGKEDDAEKDLKTVIHFNPDSAAAHFLLARAYPIKGSGSNQQQELQQVLKLDPAMLQARLALEASYLGAKQGQAALDVMDEAPEQQKTTVPWMLGRNSALLSLGNLNEVRAGIDRVLQQERVPEAVYQDVVLRLLKKDFAGARAGVNELLKLGITNPNVIEVLMQTYAAQKDLTTGLEVLKEVASTQPKSAGLQQSLGQWYQRAGNPVAARKAFESAKALDAHVMTADLSLADLDLQEGQIGAARQRLAAIIAAEPKNLPAQMLLARAQNGAGDRTGEIETYRSILALDPSNLIALNNLAYALALTSPDEALTFAQRAVERAPGEPSIQDTLGWIYYRKGLYGMAVGYLKTAVEKGPTPRRQFHLGMCYVKTGDQITGQKLVKDALQKEPSLVKTEQGW